MAINIACYGFYLRVGGALANNKKISGCIMEMPQIHFYYVYSFKIFDALNNLIIEIFHLFMKFLWRLCNGCTQND
jgi:hypothetical protein